MKVLVAEDDPISAVLLQRHLERWGHEVVLARDGAEAWGLFAHEDFPIVITDWMMPGLDGPELIRRIRGIERPGYTFILMLTAKSRKEDVVEGMEAGADDYLAKPFDREELRVRLRAGERIITLERALEDQNRALRDAQTALVQSEKLASLGQLAAGVAHEINNPLAYVGNNLAVLQRDVSAAMELLDGYRAARAELARAAPERAADLARHEEEIDLSYLRDHLGRLFSISRDGLRRVADIVRNLRDFARLDEAEFKEVDLADALKATIEIARYEVRKKNVRLETEFGAAPPVLAHPGKLNQVFLNLLVNAVQAVEPGGTVRVRTFAAGPDLAVVEVCDNGPGIPEQNLPRLFDPFFTTKPVGQGTGLGLAVSYGIVRDHGGTIDVESTLGEGATFRVNLPRRPPEPVAAEEAKAARA